MHFLLMPIPSEHLRSARDDPSPDGLAAFGTALQNWSQDSLEALTTLRGRGKGVLVVETGVEDASDGGVVARYAGKLQEVLRLDGPGPYPGDPAHRPPSTRGDSDWHGYVVIKDLAVLQRPVPVDSLSDPKDGKAAADAVPRRARLVVWPS